MDPSEFKWNPLKNERLKKTRGVSFDEIVQWTFISLGVHPERENQSILFFEREGYIWAVPFVASGGEIFLKTLYPSRKYTKRYRKEKGI